MNRINKEYKVCSLSLMDTSDPDITFDENGVSNHYYRYKEVSDKFLLPQNERREALQNLISEIKANGNNKPYDCIIGVSGGVDSTYVAYLVKEFGLRPLAIHFDNGWNSELAVKNIEKTLNTLEIDLYTYVVDWEEFRDIQLSFLKASTPDGEIPTDHAISALLFQKADEYGIKYILNGVNIISESILPLKWGYGYFDYFYLRNIQKKFGTKKIKSLPHFTLFGLFYFLKIKKIQMVSILNFVEYNKPTAMKLIEDKLGWVYYGGKHYESIYTRFYQAYILPKKFNIDKRKAHLSNLIFSGQMTKAEAEKLILEPICDPQLLTDDKEYLIKKLGLTEDLFEDIMRTPTRTFLDYPNNYKLFELLKRLRTFLR